jgi:hypothetical protein
MPLNLYRKEIACRYSSVRSLSKKNASTAKPIAFFQGSKGLKTGSSSHFREWQLR